MSLDESSGLAHIFGARLAALMVQSDHNHVTLARAMGVSKARIGVLIHRDKPPKPSTVLRLATALRCEPSDLDPRLANDSVPVPGSRVAKAADILAKKFKFRIEFVPMGGRFLIFCRKPGAAPDSFLPAAMVSGPNSEGGWGCLAESKLQLKVFEALNGHA